ncbi:NAD(P)H-binding protein [Actinomadura sp. HBU206391]|uniref:NAD(P)H-binding protein n=1 Tax=Actinomadura sp. HBU206391 TaxID=2731692 RepID=UPI00164FE3F5|nr:NAD(P)H-binding protein [Actinomadura sp. HBU206391]MBC6457013.1 NAD(P)H-binding protein [Actinomadura sp. HBU206391]
MLLVTGATGNVGRNVVAQLLDAGEKVRAITRDPGARTLPGDVEVLAGDLTRPETLPAALRGVDRAFLFPLFGALGGFFDVARQAGLEHVVLLSSSAVTLPSPGWIGDRHLECESAVAASGLSWTYVRPGAFMANDLAWAAQIAAGGVVRGAYGRASTAPIDERDIAAVAVRSLLAPRPGMAYELTGPESLTQIDRVRIIGETIGSPLRFEEVPAEQIRRQLIERIPPQGADFLLARLAEAQDGAAETLPTVEEVTGRPAFGYAEWVAHRAADFDPGAR